MRTFSFVCAMLLLSQAVYGLESIPSSVKQDAVPIPVGTMPQICEDVLQLFRCVCITGVQALNIPPPISATPGLNFINEMCAPALANPNTNIAQCGLFFAQNPTTLNNILAMSLDFAQDCLPMVAGVAGDALSSFVDNFVPASTP